MRDDSHYNVYKLSTEVNGIGSGLVVGHSRQQAVVVFCNLYGLMPAQVAVLFEFPLAAL